MSISFNGNFVNLPPPSGGEAIKSTLNYIPSSGISADHSVPSVPGLNLTNVPSALSGVSGVSGVPGLSVSIPHTSDTTYPNHTAVQPPPRLSPSTHCTRPCSSVSDSPGVSGMTGVSHISHISTKLLNYY